MVLSEIYIYPIKSTRGISLQSGYVERRGIQFDRRWMVVNEAGMFMSQRDFPRLALVSTRIDSTLLHVNAPGMPVLEIPMKQYFFHPVQVQVHDDVTQGISAGEDAKNWFSNFLDVPCRVVFMPEEIFRPVDSDYAHDGDIVSFADAFPLLLISQSSLDDLNTRLIVPVPMNRFRPNIVIRGCGAYDEDKWKKIRVGETIFHVVKPCSRCVTTTVDQATGIQGKEPLATLSQYRKVNGQVFFGQNVIPENNGTLHVEDTVQIIA
ncbi:MAG: MOSC N-terminal beta barrel domain-containing protein [Bacteroidota bacterium]